MNLVAADWSRMNACSEELKQYDALLERYNQTIQSVNYNLSVAVKLNTNIDQNLRAISSRMNQQRRMLRSYASALSAAALQYQNTERQLLGQKPVKAEDSTKPKWWKWIGSGGIIGGAISGIMDIVDESNPVNAVMKFIKTTVGTSGAVISALENTDTNWAKELLLGSTTTLADLKDFNGNLFEKCLGKQLSKYTDFSTAGKRVSAAAKWIGVGTTVVSNFISNQKEYKNGEISFGRSILETIGESAVDIGTDIFLTSAVTAGLIAVVGGAPAIVVGAGVVAAKWGLDWVSTQLTGKKFSEAVSDAVIDTGKAVVNYVGKAASSVGNAVKGAGKYIGAKWRKLFG